VARHRRAAGATTTFLQRNIGDALVTFEKRGPWQVDREFGARAKVDAVYPSVSVLAGRNPVAVIDRVVQKKGTAVLAKGLSLDLSLLRRGTGDRREALPLRVRSPKVMAARIARPSFKGDSRLFTVDEMFGRLEGSAGEALRRRWHFRPDSTRTLKR